MKTLADHLSDAGISQAELARRLGVSQPTVSDWLRGVKRPRPNRIPKIAALLRIPASRLYVDVYPSD